MLAIIFFSLAAFLTISLLLLLTTVPIASYLRRLRLLRRKPHDISSEIELEFEGDCRHLARSLVEAVSKSIGVDQNQLLLSDRFDKELAIFKSKRFSKFVEAFDLDWTTVCDDWRINFDEFEMEAVGSIRDSIRNARKKNDA